MLKLIDFSSKKYIRNSYFLTMKIIELNPNQIITLNDYPVYSDYDLKKYFEICQLKGKLPYIPVIKKRIVKKHLDNKLLKKFQEFEQENPKAEYFMLDGTHRTTALTLSGCKITTIVYEKDEDIIEAKELVAIGQILENATLYYSLKKKCEILNKHFNVRSYFMTVEQKTKRMVKEKVVPQCMIDSYK